MVNWKRRIRDKKLKEKKNRKREGMGKTNIIGHLDMFSARKKSKEVKKE